MSGHNTAPLLERIANGSFFSIPPAGPAGPSPWFAAPPPIPGSPFVKRFQLVTVCFRLCQEDSYEQYGLCRRFDISRNLTDAVF